MVTLSQRCLLLLILVLAGCSLVKTGYRLSDWWIERQVDRYVDWNSAQQAVFDAELDALMDWHRDTQLPRYRDWLLALRNDLREPLSPEQLQARVAQSEAFFTGIGERGLPASAQLLASLSDRQIAELAQRLADRQQELAREYLGENQRERRQRRSEVMRDSVERFTGTLNREQRALIEEWAARDNGSTALWLENRQQWLDLFLHAVRTRRDAGALEQALRPLLLDPALDPAYERRLAENQRHIYRLLADLHASLDHRQRRHLDARLTQWARWMDDLSGQDAGEAIASAPP